MTPYAKPEQPAPGQRARACAQRSGSATTSSTTPRRARRAARRPVRACAALVPSLSCLLRAERFRAEKRPCTGPRGGDAVRTKVVLVVRPQIASAGLGRRGRRLRGLFRFVQHLIVRCVAVGFLYMHVPSIVFVIKQELLWFSACFLIQQQDFVILFVCGLFC